MSEVPLHGQESDWAFLLLCVAAYIGVFIGFMSFERTNKIIYINFKCDLLEPINVVC